MREGYYGKEPFDLRLTVLRLLVSLKQIIILTLIGTLIFGGGYYVKNVLMRTYRQYSATSAYKVDYTTPPVASGDYFINEATWNSLVQTNEFLTAVQEHITEETAVTKEEIAGALSVKLPSDWNMPTTTVITEDETKSLCIARAVESAMQENLAAYLDEVAAIRVMTNADMAQEVKPDVRPVRAFVLSAILSCFFVVVVFLLKETGEDGIWLPNTLYRRYGLKVLGTINSPEIAENIAYLFADKEEICVFAAGEGMDTTRVITQLEKVLREQTQEESGRLQKKWVQLPSPRLCPESAQIIRKAEGTLLVVPAGRHAGKPLEYVLEYLQQQDCKVTAAILWDADEWLIKTYYCLNHQKR